MTVRVYRWDDDSAPTLSASAGSLIALLDAVLVNGYGTKVAAGWTKAYAGTNTAGYTNAGSGCGVLVAHTATATAARFYGYESITSEGVVTGRFPTDAQLSGGLYSLLSSTADSTARPWLIVATEKYFYLWVGHAVTTTVGLATTGVCPIIFAGDIISRVPGDAYHFAVIGGTTATTGQIGTLSSSLSTSSGHYIARPYTQIGTAEQFGKAMLYLFAQQGIGVAASGTTYPDPVAGGMMLSPIYVGVVSLWRGVMPGLWGPMHSLPGSPGDTFTGTGELAGKTFILLDAIAGGSTRARVALEISDTVS